MKTFSTLIILHSLLLAELFVPPAAKAESEAKQINVLLASESTRFKKALIEELDALLKQSGYKVTKADHSRDTWGAIKASDYDAVFITNSGVNSQVRPWIQEWLKKNAESSAFILLQTTQTSDWKVSANVDSVTSASAIKDVKKLAADYHKRIEDALKVKPAALPAPQ